MARHFALPLALVFIAVGALMYAVPAEPADGCTFDHTAINPDGETTVQICDDLDRGDKAISGLSYAHNRTIQVEPNVHMDRVYVHELGHQSGFGHEEDTIMDPKASTDLPRCGLENTERQIAQEWDTLSIESIGPCQYIDTPYGKVF